MNSHAKWIFNMPIDLSKLHESAIKNTHSFIELLKEDLLNSHDSDRELGSLTDLYNELESLYYDISRGVHNNLMNRFEEIFSIAEGYNVSWSFYKKRFYDDLVEDINFEHSGCK